MNALADSAGVSVAHISRIESGERPAPSPSFIKRLSTAIGHYEEMMETAGYISCVKESSQTYIPNLIPLEESYLIDLPVYGRIAAGEPMTAIQDVEEHMLMDTRFFNMNGYTKEDFFFLRIKGTSMEPTIMDKDLVLVRKQPTVENNEIAAVMCDNEDATVKRVMVAGDKIILHSDNKEKPPMIFNCSDCQIIGKVIKKIGDVK